MLDAIGAGTQKQIGKTDWADLWNQSEEFATVKREIEEINEDALKKEDVRNPEDNKEYSTNFWHQLRVVGERTLTAFYRNPDYGKLVIARLMVLW
jgi:ATP-binding cassette subfamily G (WHITE) protein 2 (SNQ2)